MKIAFEDKGFEALEIAPGTPLADALDGPHSPVFFGCKSGNCGTCLVELDPEGAKLLPPPEENERDLLEALAPDSPTARLACQLSPNHDLKIKYLN